MFFAKKILCGIALIGVLAILPSVSLADYRHDSRGDHGRRDDHRDYARRDDHRDVRRDDHRDYHPAPPQVYAPAPQAPVVVNVPVTVNVPAPAPVACAPLGPDVISPSYKQWEVLYRTNPDAPWQISSEYSNRTDAERAANSLEAQGYDTMLRLP